MALTALPLAAGGAGAILSLLWFLVVVGVSVYVYRDAKRLDSRHALAWALASFFGSIVVWILYFAVRDEVGR
ncbi:hypothetical protein [Halocalculus aciditolerans]|nr:hypothetical protein [Halocalculus aciditolerans]